MKKSNVYILLLILAYCAAVFGTNKALVRSYSSIQLEDPYKNYDEYPVNSFTKLRLEGGNSFAVKIRSGAAYGMRVMKSRTEFLKYAQHGDSLSIEFTVPQTSSEQVPTGIILTCPALSLINATGARVMLDSLQASHLTITQRGRSGLELRNTSISQLTIYMMDDSWLNFINSNQGRQLYLHAFNRARINVQDINYPRIETDLRDSSSVTLSAASLKKIREN